MLDNQQARYINIVLGVWLFISAFVWVHSQAQFTNTWIVGVLCVGIAVAAMRIPEVRFINTALAVWLFISVWALPSFSVGTQWNNAIVAIAIFVASLVPGLVGPREGTKPLP